jgi:hypothetical protein
MLSRSGIYIVALAGSVLAITEASAQAPAWAVGSWRGTIQGQSSSKDGPDRVLVIGADGKCKWDIGANSAKPSTQSCTVGANSVSISTGPGSTVDMQHKNGKLEGTWQPRSGRSYPISMTKQ